MKSLCTSLFANVQAIISVLVRKYQPLPGNSLTATELLKCWAVTSKCQRTCILPTYMVLGGRVGLVVRALAFHQCGPGSISALGVIRGLSLLVLYSAMRGFPPGTPVFPSHQKPTFDLICRKTVVNLNDLNNVDLISFQ